MPFMFGLMVGSLVWIVGVLVPGRDAQGRGGGGMGAAAGARRRWGQGVRDGLHRRPMHRPLRPRLHEPVSSSCLPPQFLRPVPSKI